MLKRTYKVGASLLGEQELNTNLTEQFVELLHELYEAESNCNIISVKDYVQEIAEKLERIIIRNG